MTSLLVRSSTAIAGRYGWKRLTIFFACAFTVIGVIGWVKISPSDRPPSCAKQYVNVANADAQTRNAMVDCDIAVEKWCAKHHLEDPDGCSNAIEIDGDARNVGKD